MKHHKLSLIAFVFVLSSFFFVQAAHAETLLFKPGDKASYSIQQKLTAEIDIFRMFHYDSNAKIDLNVKILNVDEQTQSYPFDVEVTLKKISIMENHEDGYSSGGVKFDSSYRLDTRGNRLVTEYYDKLINHPLNFRVEGDFRVKETTGYLAQCFESLDGSPIGLFGGTPWSYELFLTQLFHLAGQDLLPENFNPVSCFQFLYWEDEALDEKELNIDQSSYYNVTQVDSKKIKATWQGNAKVNGIIGDMIGDMSGAVTVRGNVSWNSAKSISQERSLEFTIEQEIKDGFFPGRIKLSGTQTWKPN